MKTADRILKQHIPYYGAMKKAGAFQRQEKKPGGSGANKKVFLTEINHNGKTVLKGKTTVAAALNKLRHYEETGLQPYEVQNLKEREINLMRRIDKLEGWENG